MISFPARLRDLATQHPDKPAVVLARVDRTETVLTYGELCDGATRLAHVLAGRGAGPNSFVVIALPNSLQHYVVSYATWMLGACVLPVNPQLPDAELAKVLELVPDRIVVDVVPDLSGVAADPLPDVISNPGKAIPSGGSTGRPKVIVEPGPWARTPGKLDGLIEMAGLRTGQVQIVPGGLYHNTPFGWGHIGLFEDHTVVVMQKFDPAHAIDLIKRHRVNFAALVPTMMGRMAKVDGVTAADLSSLDGIMHTAAACPPWVKRAWIDLIGGDKIIEGFGSTDYLGACIIRGDEWLEHPGSVGRPADCDVRIVGDDGKELAAGEVGEIYMRLRQPDSAVPTFEYIGAPDLTRTEDGFATVGDLGWVDEDGYVFVADRRVDMIVTGGANVYPAEVEASLSDHPGVADVAVIGVPDEDWGRRVHAVVQPTDVGAPPSVEELIAHARRSLASYKCPKTVEFVDELPRNQAGKIRRSDLLAERLAP